MTDWISFKKMAEADPGNELGHFSLGRALLDAGMPGEAVAPLRRTLS
jgi:predicted Zn-dependent protease